MAGTKARYVVARFDTPDDAPGAMLFHVVKRMGTRFRFFFLGSDGVECRIGPFEV